MSRPGGWAGSNRRSRLPPDWNTVKRPEATRRNPQHICHWCKLPGGDELDHIIPGDNHQQDNLDWIHGRRTVESGVSTRNCHGEKTALEAAAARPREKRPKPIHPGLR